MLRYPPLLRRESKVISNFISRISQENSLLFSVIFTAILDFSQENWSLRNKVFISLWPLFNPDINSLDLVRECKIKESVMTIYHIPPVVLSGLHPDKDPLVPSIFFLQHP